MLVLRKIPVTLPVEYIPYDRNEFNKKLYIQNHINNNITEFQITHAIEYLCL